ncbi:MAG: TRAM domain-containing protein [Candidatus Methanoperedens sp.]|nr:TRAM domain-containing protein [Candidatus Methanoperedens sp.]
MRGDQEGNAPVTVGETYDVTIDDLAKKGDGIARVKGFVIFVPQTKAGDRVKIKVNKVMRKFAFAEKVE